MGRPVHCSDTSSSGGGPAPAGRALRPWSRNPSGGGIRLSAWGPALVLLLALPVVMPGGTARAGRTITDVSRLPPVAPAGAAPPSSTFRTQIHPQWPTPADGARGSARRSVPVTPTPPPPVPSATPPFNVPPSPDFLASCSSHTEDDSATCTRTTLAAIDNARALQGVAPMVLPDGWATLSPAHQLFVATNLERVARGMAPLAGESELLDESAAVSAATSDDAVPPATLSVGRWGSNWAGGLGNALEVVYYWMYDDGPGSPNVTCTSATPGQCWGHRDNVLLALACSSCQIGVAVNPAGWEGGPAWSEILADVAPAAPVETTWAEIRAG